MAKNSIPSATASSADDDGQDAQTTLKRRARRRLIGAAALALLAVVVLPMVMDHEPRPPSLDIQVRIPSQDAGMAGSGPVGALASRILPGKAPTPLPPMAESRGTAPAPAPVAAAAPAGPAAAEPASASPAPAKAEAVPPKPEPVRKAEAKPAEKAAARESPAADKVAAESKRAAAALNGGTASQWVVQLGAYRDAGNVKVLLAKLKEMGVPAYTEKYDSPQGPRTRVRAGPFATKEAAEKAQVRAKAIGVNGPVAAK